MIDERALSSGRALDVSRIVLGCVGLSTLPTRQAAFRLLEKAVDLGIRHFDTARAYGGGYSERVLGEFLAVHGEGLAVTTKLGPVQRRFAALPSRLALPMNYVRNRFRSTPPHRPPDAAAVSRPTRVIARGEIEASVAESLRCLRRSRLDVFLLHECLPSQLDDVARDCIARLRADGTLGAFGIGTARRTIEAWFTDDPLCEILQYDRAPDRSQELINRYPLKRHFHHSLYAPPLAESRIDVLRRSLADNPAGKVIFGTRRLDHLADNLGVSS